MDFWALGLGIIIGATIAMIYALSQIRAVMKDARRSELLDAKCVIYEDLSYFGQMGTMFSLDGGENYFFHRRAASDEPVFCQRVDKPWLHLDPRR